MLTQEDYWMIQDRLERGVYQKDVATELGVHPRTVRRALARGGPPQRGRRREKLLKLKPYLWKVDALLADNVWNGQVILREIQALGYTGGRTTLCDYIRPKRVLRPGRATVRFETGPGEQLQHDWGELHTRIGGELVKVHFAVNTLGYSRRFHAWAAWCEDAEHTYESLVQAFDWFGGVTGTVLVDNQKAAVLKHGPNGPCFNERFRALARHYGFRARACRPKRAQTKGKVERMVGYVKHHFFVRYRAFDSMAHLNQQLEQWLIEEADRRDHGTVHEVVAERFAREAPALQPLPVHRFDTSYHLLRHVAWDGYVEVAGCRYSVPAAYAGQAVTVRRHLDGRLVIEAGGRIVAEHQQRAVADGTWITVPDHHRRLWQALKVAQRPLGHYEEVLACNSTS